MKIGIFDSGIGGLNMLAKLLKIYSNNSYIYYADNKNIPYGNKSFSFIKQNVVKAMDYFENRHVDVVILACNTVSSMLGDYIKQHYKFTLYKVQPNLSYLNRYSSLYLMATNNTLKTLLNNYYESICNKTELQKLHVLNSSNLAYLTEQCKGNFYENFPIVRNIIKDVPIGSVLLLGCTHYTYYQQYLESLGYVCHSELDFFQSENAKNIDYLPENKNLMVKLTNPSKICDFLRILRKIP